MVVPELRSHYIEGDQDIGTGTRISRGFPSQWEGAKELANES